MQIEGTRITVAVIFPDKLVDFVPKQGVSEGIIDAVGGISDAFAKLYQLIGENS
jgi:hypothetical protein